MTTTMQTGSERTRLLELGGVDPGSALPRGLGRSDPSCAAGPGVFARAVHTPGGPGTVRFDWSSGGHVTVAAWGPTDVVDWLLDAAPAWLGLGDDVSTFRPQHPLVAALWRRAPGARLGASRVVWSELLPTIVSQRVQFPDAARSWRRLVRAHGSPAPGGLGLWLAPSPERLRSLGYHDLHRFDLERRRADALLAAARHADRLEETAAMPLAAAVNRLQAVPGLGAWTATSVAAAAFGHPDTVVLGDFWFPTVVRHALAGDRRWCPDDGPMLTLLEPFSGHRGRVVRMLCAAGFQPARRAPRRAPHRFAHF
jgi:3-methyladenine DNA glycosylase/8-oxoguanine DNA glycosylase